MKYSYQIKLDINKDAWNWWDGCNFSYASFDWTKSIDRKILQNIQHKEEKIAYNFLIPYLKKYYIDRKTDIAKTTQHINNQFGNNLDKGCDLLAKTMGKPLYCKNFIIYLTTFDRAPYDKDEGSIMFPITWTDPMAVFLHELCHFQFIHYWRENPKSMVSKISDDQFEYLKESLTMILDEDFLPIIKKPDKGYPVHQKLRQKLKKYYKKEKNFQKLVDYALKNINTK